MPYQTGLFRPQDGRRNASQTRTSVRGQNDKDDANMPLECLLDLTTHPPDAPDLYTRLDLPDSTSNRPCVFVNMAATADGKIVVGDKDGAAKGVGGPTDQILFRRLQAQAQAAMIGGTTLRAGTVIYPPTISRYVISRGGDVPLHNRFFTDAPERAFVVVPEDLDALALARLRAGANVLTIGRGGVNLSGLLRVMRQSHGIERLLCEGGASLNDALIRANLADELFLTLAPKLKGGANLPTILGGQGFASGMVLPLTLRSLYRDGDELYLRYRLAPAPMKV